MYAVGQSIRSLLRAKLMRIILTKIIYGPDDTLAC